jgi:superfamily I DNA/RNA helicase
VTRRRQGRFGTGALVAPLGSAIGLDADVVFVVGLAEKLVQAQTGQVQVRSELSLG